MEIRYVQGIRTIRQDVKPLTPAFATVRAIATKKKQIIRTTLPNGFRLTVSPEGWE